MLADFDPWQGNCCGRATAGRLAEEEPMINQAAASRGGLRKGLLEGRLAEEEPLGGQISRSPPKHLGIARAANRGKSQRLGKSRPTTEKPLITGVTDPSTQVHLDHLLLVTRLVFLAE